jgi:hypothetical protein
MHRPLKNEQLNFKQVHNFGPHAKYLRKCTIIIFAYSAGDKMKLATSKLDNLGYIILYGPVQNNPERLR